VDPDGAPWIVNQTGGISRLGESGWEDKPGKARDIGIGANGSVWAIGWDEVEDDPWGGSFSTGK
jgi:hypothetical protein